MSGKNVSTANTAIGRAREEGFRSLMAARGIRLERPTAPFRFQRARYLPDFYAPEQGLYYEVLGSPGPSNRIPLILDLMAIFHPSVQLVCVRPSGEVFDPCRSTLNGRRYVWLAALPFGAALLTRMSTEGLRYEDLARLVGLTPGHLSMIIHGTRRMPERTRARLESFAVGGAA